MYLYILIYLYTYILLYIIYIFILKFINIHIKFKEKVKEFLGRICIKVPSIEGECQEFIDTYGDAIVAILVQEIDPSQVLLYLNFL